MHQDKPDGFLAMLFMKISDLQIFQGLSEENIHKLTDYGCLRRESFGKNQLIFRRGDITNELGVVIEGNVTIESTDILGNRMILGNVEPYEVFAETYALCLEPLMVDVSADMDTEVLFLNVRKLASLAPDDADIRPIIIENMLKISVRKNLQLSRRNFFTSPKTIRGRLLMYLSSEASKTHSMSFDISFDRQGLADYLNLDRSALSKELGCLRDEGILEFRKNHFTLKSDVEWLL